MKLRINIDATVWLSDAANDDPKERERFRRVKKRIKAMDDFEIAKVVMGAIEREQAPRIGFKA